MNTPKEDALAEMVADQHPLLTVELQREIRRVAFKNSGPPMWEKNVCEVAENFSEELFAFVKTEGDLVFNDKTEVLCRHGRLVLTRAGHNRIMKYFAEAQILKGRLRALSDMNLEVEYRSFKARKRKELDEIRSGHDKFAFFNDAEADARYTVWLRLPFWTGHEAVALSYGKDPEVVNQATLEAYLHAKESMFCKNYAARLRAVERAIQAGILDEKVSPLSFVEWCGNNEVEIAAPLLAVSLRNTTKRDFQSEIRLLKEKIELLQNDAEPLKGKPKRSTLLKLVIGMAIARFEHRTGKNSNATAAIEGSLQSVVSDEQNTNKFDITVSNEMIRRILQEAEVELDIGWPQEIKWRGARRL